MSGLTQYGFQIKTFEQVKLEIETTMQDSFGSINLSESSVFSQLIGIFAEREALIWQAALGVYSSLYPDTATGFSLDGVCQLSGITRLDATATKVVGELTGINQTLVFKDSEASALGVPTTFMLVKDTIISNDQAREINIEVTDINQIVYDITINGETSTYIATLGANEFTIMTALIADITLNSPEVTASIVNNFLNVRSNVADQMSIYISPGLSIVDVTVDGNFIASTKGLIALPANSLHTIQTPTSGWLAINNRLAGATGRNRETDDELRLRRNKSLKLPGGASVEAITARLSNVTGVSSVKVIENTTFAVDSGMRPPKSFEALVLGGLDQDIGDTIWAAKAAGIESYGNIAVTIIDSTGRNQIVHFSRPVPLYIYVKVTLTLATSGGYPLDGDSRITNGIVNQINVIGVGQDVIYQSFYQSVYSIPGIVTATIEIGGSLVVGPPPPLTAANVIVGATQIPVSDMTKINIVKI